jgi:hypothetical protein
LEAAATGVLRAMAARGGATRETAAIETRELVASGFSVDIFLRCGGRRLPETLNLGRSQGE